MKKLIIIYPLILFSFTTGLYAQKVNQGVYLSASDFSSAKISYVNNQSKSCKLYTHENFNTSTIKIIMGDSIIRLNKDAIFGYRDKRNTCYRFYNKTSYTILDPTEKILLYSTTHLEGNHRDAHWVTSYFFSADASSPIYSLSKWNLQTVFKNDVAFIEMLNTYFESDSKLITYDSINRIYNLNRMYQMLVQNK